MRAATHYVPSMMTTTLHLQLQIANAAAQSAGVQGRVFVECRRISA